MAGHDLADILLRQLYRTRPFCSTATSFVVSQHPRILYPPVKGTRLTVYQASRLPITKVPAVFQVAPPPSPSKIPRAGCAGRIRSVAGNGRERRTTRNALVPAKLPRTARGATGGVDGSGTRKPGTQPGRGANTQNDNQPQKLPPKNLARSGNKIK